LLHPGPIEGGDGVGDGGTPVLADDAELVEAQVGGQFYDVTGHRGGVVAGQGALGAAGASIVERDDGVVRGQQRHDMAPVRHGLRHAVQQEDRIAVAADCVVDLHAVDLGLAVREPDSGVVTEVHRRADFFRLFLQSQSGTLGRRRASHGRWSAAATTTLIRPCSCRASTSWLIGAAASTLPKLHH
jgi:hypothetical protein